MDIQITKKFSDKNQMNKMFRMTISNKQSKCIYLKDPK